MPAIHPGNVGMLKPSDLLGAINLFESKYEESD